MAELERILAEEGVDLPLQPFGQGYREQGPAVRAFEEAILNRTLRHNGNPLLTWCVSNVVPNTDPTGAVKLDKDRSRERIDPVVAAVMAIGLAAREPERKGYDFSGDRVLAF
jgi:phage terminase large subunit-like protein